MFHFFFKGNVPVVADYVKGESFCGFGRELRKGLKVIVCVTPTLYSVLQVLLVGSRNVVYMCPYLEFILDILACRRNMCILNQVESQDTCMY